MFAGSGRYESQAVPDDGARLPVAGCCNAPRDVVLIGPFERQRLATSDGAGTVAAKLRPAGSGERCRSEQRSEESAPAEIPCGMRNWHRKNSPSRQGVPGRALTAKRNPLIKISAVTQCSTVSRKLRLLDLSP